MSRRQSYRATEPIAGEHRLLCRLCGHEGLVTISRVKRDTAVVTDFIPHDSECLLGPQKRTKRPPPWLNKSARQRVRRQENAANRLVGAHATLASGAVRGDHDGRNPGRWCVECKQTAKTFRLASTYWNDLSAGAEQNGEEPLLHVQTLQGTFVAVRAAYFDLVRPLLPRVLLPEAREAPVFPLLPAHTVHCIGGDGFREDVYVMPESIFLTTKEAVYPEVDE